MFIRVHSWFVSFLFFLAMTNFATANAATITVTNTNDSGASSLRQALADANDGDMIQFDPALNGQTITLTSGELSINKNITINGPGPDLLTVSTISIPKFPFRVFHINPGHNVTIAGLTISDGHAIGSVGGGILNEHSTLTINDCTISNNHSDSNGAGIYNDGSASSANLTILNSTISGNQAFSTQALVAGGGIANDGSNGGSATLTITNSRVTGNAAEYDRPGGAPFEGNGGGIYNGGGATLTITNSVVSNNTAGPGSNANTGHGGGIWSSGAAMITDSTINGNLAGFGGGISNSGPLSITGSTVNKNTAAGYHIMFGIHFGDGGGIDSNGGPLTITNTTLSGNRCQIYGGAVHGAAIITNCIISNNQNMAGGAGGGLSGAVAVINSTISGNEASIGGGIYGDPAITNCTISGNEAYYSGGGISGSPTVTNCTISGNMVQFGAGGGGMAGGGIIRHCTITGNTAANGGGGIQATAPLEIANTILKTGASGANLLNNGGTVTSHGYNISNDDGAGFLTGPGDQINTDPLLGPLQDNGGPTFTHDLLAGSPAINTGDPNFTPPPSTDQRGYARVFNGRVDIGSLEVQPTPPPITISGTISYCSNPVPGPVPNVTLTLTGSMSGSTFSNGSGNYSFSGLISGGTYTVTPTKAALPPGSAGINTTDVIAVQRHFLIIGTPLSGCRLTAADVNGDTLISTVDVIAIQRFFLQLTTGIANVGSYQFTPTNRTYPNLNSNQTGQNYDTLVFGDVAPPFVE